LPQGNINFDINLGNCGENWALRTHKSSVGSLRAY